ncbi:MAG: universal stress protein [Deltaproteobacteria bacterium]|nr:universal stress protein [Deltaproteobacteria bacterium]
MKAPQQILVPTDFSTYSAKALQEGLFLAKQFNAKLHLLHVVEDIQQCAADYCLEESFVRQYRTSGVENSKQKLMSELAKYPEAKELQITTNVRVGRPEEEILKEEKEKNVDLIVIASHGKTGFLQYLMGSVAERVSRGAKCEVMLVKA